MDQSEDYSDSDSKNSKERRASRESLQSQKELEKSENERETKIEITVEKEEENALLEEKLEIGNQNDDCSNVESAENDLKHIDEDWKLY